jgi:putative transposase
MGLARSTYYDEPASQPIEEARLVDRIKETCAEWPAYGYRRVTAQLRAEGSVVTHKKVRRLMREHDVTVRPRKRFVATTDSDHDGPIFPNLARDIVPARPNQLWVADITYIAIAVGFVYLAAILDAWSRRAVGYAISRRVDARLALAALKAATRADSRPSAASIIPIAARNMPPRSTAPSSISRASPARWAGAATPMTTPRPRAS